MIKGSVTPPFVEASSRDKVVFTCVKLTTTLEPLHQRDFHGDKHGPRYFRALSCVPGRESG